MTSFRDAYRVLQQHADTLRNQTEPNIDDLLTIVNESVKAYEVCKKRIDAVEKALEQALEGSNIPDMPEQGEAMEKPGTSTAGGSAASETPQAPASPQRNDSSGFMDMDDIPF